MATLSASRRNSAANAVVSSTPRPSITGNNSIPRISSLNEEDDTTSRIENINNEINSQKAERIYTSSLSGKILKEICDNGDRKKLYRSRSCSERSDSGISDCSNHATTASCGGSCTSTPLLGKKFSINEEPEDEKRCSLADTGTVKENSDCSAPRCDDLVDKIVSKSAVVADNDESITTRCRLEGKFFLLLGLAQRSARYS